MKGAFLGIDTSNYTTSAALCDEDGSIIANLKRPLPVAKGQRGLRQSDAVFHHTAALPEVLSELREPLAHYRLLAVGVSARPRDAKGSYMPCFLAGVSAATALAVGAAVPLYSFSHQSGHIMAALYSSGKTEFCGSTFAAFHVSGGTTDILLVEPDDTYTFKVSRIGGTLDINGGQLVDRTGVRLGMDFPCGPALESAAAGFSGKLPPVKISVKGLDCNLSGGENIAAEIIKNAPCKKTAGEAGAAYVFEFLRRTLEKLSKNLSCAYPGIPVVYAGGVMSSTILKESLAGYGSFAKPEFSSDNAAGTSLLVRREYLKEH